MSSKDGLLGLAPDIVHEGPNVSHEQGGGREPYYLLKSSHFPYIHVYK